MDRSGSRAIWARLASVCGPTTTAVYRLLTILAELFLWVSVSQLIREVDRERHMEDHHTDWLREHMRDQIASTRVVSSADNVPSFQRPSYSSKNPGATVIDLVHQTVELIGDVENCAAEKHARAEALVNQALEKLKKADDRVRSAESAQRAAEAEIKEFSDRVQEIEKEMQRTASRMAAAEAQLTGAEQRANTAEMRANEAENALKRIEEMIRIQILEKRPSYSSKKAAMAA